MQFSDKQTTISINSDTEIVSMARGQQGMTMNRLQASDLKEGDIVTIWLDSDKKTAHYIMQRFNPANFRKAGNQG
jgi:hypothetical protein